MYLLDILPPDFLFGYWFAAQTIEHGANGRTGKNAEDPDKRLVDKGQNQKSTVWGGNLYFHHIGEYS